MDEFRRDWDDYLEGIAYKTRIKLFHTVNRNERFYAGRHWEGVDTAGLPQVMLPLVERVVNWKVVQVMSEPLSMIFSAETAANGNREPEEMKKVAQLFTDYAKTTWERLKQDSLNERALLDAALSGDAIAYFYWNETIDAGNGAKGDISEELIDNVNYFPGDTTDPRPNDEKGPIQPYIILAFRKQVEDIKREAMRYGASESDLQNITADEETEYQAGDRARDEHCSGTKEGGKCTVLLRMWREYVEEPETDAMGQPVLDPMGQPLMKQKTIIMARKSVRSAVVRPDWNTGRKRYPVAVMNWKLRKNSCHGEAEATSLIPNNIAINKQLATAVLWTMLNAYPKPIYDQSRIDEWSNDITQAIAVDGEITNAAAYLKPSENGIPSSAVQLFETLIQTTKDMAGANETALGDTSVTKTASGILALQKASTMPLATVRRRFRQWVEDIGLIWLDFWQGEYGAERILPVKNREGKTLLVPYDGTRYRDAAFRLRIDVGASTQFSEEASAITLENLLGANHITFRQYLERAPEGFIPKKQELIDEIDRQDEDRQILYKLMARFVESLPPEIQLRLETLRQRNPEQYETAVKKLIGGIPDGVPGVQNAADGGGEQVLQ